MSSVETYKLTSLNTSYKGTVDNSGVPATILNVSCRAVAFLYNDNGTMSLKDLDITNHLNRIYYGNNINYLNVINVVSKRVQRQYILF
jgi:hypothetical protein